MRSKLTLILLILISSSFLFSCSLPYFRSPIRPMEVPLDLPRLVGQQVSTPSPIGLAKPSIEVVSSTKYDPWEDKPYNEESNKKKAEALDPDDPYAISDLIDMTRNVHSGVRQTALGILTYVRPMTEEIMDAIAERLGDEMTSVRAQASISMITLGDDALPYLDAALESDNAYAREAAIRTLGRMAVTDQRKLELIRLGLQDQSYTVRRSACEMAANAGEAGHFAIPMLIDLILDDSSYTRYNAAETLGTFGDAAIEALPALVRSSFDSYFRTRDQVRETIEAIQPDALEDIRQITEATGLGYIFGENFEEERIYGLKLENDADVKVLTDALVSDSYIERWMAADMLRRTAEDSHSAIPALIAALDDDDPWLVAFAADALGEIGIAAGEAVAKLTGISGSKDLPEFVQAHATLASARIRGVMPMVSLLSSDDPWIRKNAAEAIGVLGTDASHAAPYLNELMSDDDWRVRVATRRAMLSIGVATEEVIDALFQELITNGTGSRGNAAVSLGKIGADVVPRLIEILETSEDKNLIRPTSQALARIGPPAIDAIDPLIKHLDNPDQNVRAWIIRAIGPIGLNSSKVADALISTFNTDDSNWVRTECIRYIGNMNPSASEKSIPFLKGLLDRKAPEIPVHALRALWFLDGQKQEYADQLVSMLDTAEGHKSDTIVRALGDIGPAAKAAVPKLISFIKKKEGLPLLNNMRDESSDILRSAVIVALGKIGPAAADAVPLIIDALHDDYSWIPKRAAVALGDIGPAAKEALEPLRQYFRNNGIDEDSEWAMEIIAAIQGE